MQNPIQTVSVSQMLSQVCQLTGIETSRVLEIAQLSERDCREELAADSYFTLFAAVRREYDAQHPDGTFEADLARRFAKGPYLAPGLAFSTAPTLLVGLKQFARYKPLIAPVILDVQEDETQIDISMCTQCSDLPLPALMGLFEMLLIVEKMRICVAADLAPIGLRLPEGADLDYVQTVLNAAGLDVTVHTACDAGMVLRRADGARPLLSANPALWATIEPTLEAELRQRIGRGIFTERLARELATSLPEGVMSADELALRLGLSKRSLQRKLRAEETSFQQVLNDTRAELAQSYLSTSGLSVAEISHRLGFRSVSSFFRNFQSWVGMTPRAFRDRQQGGGTGTTSSVAQIDNHLA